MVFFLSAFRRSFRSEARGCEEILSLTTVYQQQPRCCRTFSSLFINPLPPFTVIIMIIRPFPSPLVCLSTAGAVGIPHNPSVLQRDPGLSSRLFFFTLEERRQVQGFSSLQLFVGQCDRSAGYDVSMQACCSQLDGQSYQESSSPSPPRFWISIIVIRRDISSCLTHLALLI